jgi:hypothetical protein
MGMKLVIENISVNRCHLKSFLSLNRPVETVETPSMKKLSDFGGLWLPWL